MNDQQQTLTPELVQKVIEAQVRLKELGAGSKIINPRSEAEITGLKNFLSDIFLQHSSEFVGCWVAIRQEYEPLIQTLERIANRVITNREAIRAMQLPAQTANAEGAAK